MFTTMMQQYSACLQYTSKLAPEQGAIIVDTIYPASAKHVSKHTTQKFVMVSVQPGSSISTHVLL